MSRTSAPVLTSLLLLLLLLLLVLPRDSAAATKKQQLKSCKSLDEVLFEKYVTEQKRSSSGDYVSENAAVTPLLSGSSTDSNWLVLFLLLQDRAEQLCNSKLYTLLHKRYSDYNRQDNVTTAAVPVTTAVNNQQANNVILSSTAQKGSTWINASTARPTYNNDELSGKFSSEKEDSTTSYYDSSSSSILPGNFNQTFAITDNEASGNNSNETLARDNEDESYRNEAIHADSKEKFQRHKKQPPLDQDSNRIVKKFFESEDEIVDVRRSDSIEIDGNSTTIDEHDKFVDDFFANENSAAFNETVDEHDDIVDDFFANENESFSVSDFVNSNSTETLSRENDTAGDKFADDLFANEHSVAFNETANEHDAIVDDFFANENESFSVGDFVNSNSTETLSRENDSVGDKFVDDLFANENSAAFNETVDEHDDIVDDFFANENKSFSVSDTVNSNSTETLSRENDSAGDKFVDDFFANESKNLSENEIRGSWDSKKVLDESQNNNTTSERDEFVDDFFASENENITSNWIGSEEPSKDSRGTLDDKANDNKTASSEFNPTKSYNDVSSNSSSAKLTSSMERSFEKSGNENENSTIWQGLTNSIQNENSTISQEVSLTKNSDELFDEANATSSTIAQVSDFFTNSSSENSLSKLENSTESIDSSELISFLEAAISSEEKNAAAAAQLRTYSNETAATLANGTEDRSTKYPDTGDRNKAGHTTSSDDDLFKETTTAAAAAAATAAAATMTTMSLDDWSRTIASIKPHADEKVSEPAAPVQRRRRDILMTFQDDEASVDFVSAGKLRAPEATPSSSVRLVSEEDDSGSSGAWESSNVDSSLNTRASSRNRPPRIITSEMNKGSSELQRQYRTFLLGLQSRQTQFAEKRDSRHLDSQTSTKVE